MADRTFVQGDADLWRRTGQAVPADMTARIVNACANDCDPLTWPRPAEAATDIGADDDRPGQGAGTLIWPAVGAVLLAALGYGVSLLLHLIKT